MIVFSNDSGLGAQTRRLCYMLKPNRVLVVDLSLLSKNRTHHIDWYESFKGYKVRGFPTDREVRVFLRGLTDVFLCENALNNTLYSVAKQMNIRVFIQTNYEFCDHLNKKIELPYKFLMPSHWHVSTMKNQFGDDRVQYLPPPINPNDFVEAREINFLRDKNRMYMKPRFLHIIGTLAVHDRNGTLDLLDSLRYSKADFDLVIRSQHDLTSHYETNDPRVTYQIGNIVETQDLYADFDALILPRRYGGLSLTTNEALMSALPVIMTDISPNNQLLPDQWLVKATKKMSFMTRTMIDVYEVDKKKLAQKLDWLTKQNFDTMKTQAFAIGHNKFSEGALREAYQQLWSQ